MKSKTFVSLLAVLSAGSLWAFDPSVAIDSVSQDADGLVTVRYTLSGASAIVTLDVETNVTDDVWASAGGAALRDVSGDVHREIAVGAHHILWRPTGQASEFSVNSSNVRLSVNAWSKDDPPDYLVVDLFAQNQPKCYYPYEESLPGGLLDNAEYRTKKLVLRRIHAKGVPWKFLGTIDVTLDHDYYIGVFPLTEMQYMLVNNNDKDTYDGFYFHCQGAMRPVNVCFARLREVTFYKKATQTCISSCAYPNPPWQYSTLGMMRTKHGLDFDAPTEAEWEFACRAGIVSNELWNNGTPCTESNCPGRHRTNGGWLNGGTTAPTEAQYQTLGATNGTAIVGSFAPNAWGLYDMHANIFEWCLDWYQDNISGLAGAVNISSENPTMLLDGETVGSKRVRRGGSYNNVWYDAKLSARSGWDTKDELITVGVRVVVRGGSAEVSKVQQ